MSTPGSTGNNASNDSLSGPSRKRSSTMGMGAAIGLAVILLLIGLAGGYYAGMTLNKNNSSSNNGSGSGGSQIQLTETGSSLVYPLIHSYWGPNYTSYNPNVVVSAASTGSGTGQASAEQGLVNLGASDGYLSNASTTNLLNVPGAISAQLVYYNLPGVSQHLNLNGSILAMIYSGVITKWNDPMILAAQTSAVQTELNALTSQTITPVKRLDSSGDTFLFSSLCYMSWSGWTYGYSTSALSGDSITSATGNSGVVTELQKNTGSIGYVGISYESQATGLTYAALGDNNTLANGTLPAHASDYVLPSADNISTDANLGLTHLQFSQYQLSVSLILGGSPAGAINLQHGLGGTAPASGATPYPLVNLEYLLVKTAPTGKTVTAAALGATVAFLEWAISYGNFGATGAESSYLAAVHFIPLTPAVIGYDMQELAQVQA